MPQTPSSRAISVSVHAVIRWTDRVDRGASRNEAALAVDRFVSLGRHRAVPRKWMRDQVTQEPGTIFVYYHERPGVCAVVREGVVVTVLTKALFVGARRHLRPVPSSPGRPIPAEERARWRWNREVPAYEETAA